MSSDGLTILPNVFQRLMLQWERFAPYNAAQFMTFAADAGPNVDPARAWRRTVIKLGLQQIGQHPDAPLFRPSGPLAAHVTAEMNRPYSPGDSPLRPFVVSEGDRLHVGVVYRHVVADSASIRVVMRDWFARLFGVAMPAQFVTLDRAADFRLFDPTRRWSLLRQATAELSRMSRVKRVRRLASVEPSRPVAWREARLPAPTIGRVVAYARREGVRVNDIFLAAAALACVRHVPIEPARTRRDVGVGTIVDTRADAGAAARRHFGLRLGFLQTFLAPEVLAGGWPATLRAAAASMRAAREQGLASASSVRLLAARAYGDRLGDADLADFYRKRCPLVGGISNVNLNRDWPGRVHPSPLLGYGRVSPTGPMLPIVFTPTTLGDALHLGFTYRTGDVTDAAADAVMNDFIAALAAVD